MTGLFCVGPQRRKAVWGPKRTIAASAMLLLAFAPSAIAGGRHAGTPHKAAPGCPNSIVKSYKLDGELEQRATRNDQNHTTRVIVELTPGARLPGSFNGLKHGGKLAIINGQVLEAPDRLVRQLAQHPSASQVHSARPAGTVNYRASRPIGTRAAWQTLGLTG